MPRSPSPLTNSDASDMSDSAAIVDDMEDDPAPAQPRDSLRELEERQAAEEAQLRASRARAQRERRTILERVVCQALREICFFYLARQLHMEFPDRRQSGAKISAHRRRLEQLEPGDIHAAITQRTGWLSSSTGTTRCLQDTMTARCLPMTPPGWSKSAKAAHRRATWRFSTWLELPGRACAPSWTLALQTSWHPGWRIKHSTYCTRPLCMCCSLSWGAMADASSSTGTMATLRPQLKYRKAPRDPPIHPGTYRQPRELGKHLRSTKIKPTKASRRHHRRRQGQRGTQSYANKRRRLVRNVLQRSHQAVTRILSSLLSVVHRPTFRVQRMCNRLRITDPPRILILNRVAPVPSLGARRQPLGPSNITFY